MDHEKVIKFLHLCTKLFGLSTFTYLLSNSILIVMVKYFGSEYEEVFYVLAGFGRGLETELDVTITLEFLYTISRHFTLLLLVLLISH